MNEHECECVTVGVYLHAHQRRAAYIRHPTTITKREERPEVQAISIEQHLRVDAWGGCVNVYAWVDVCWPRMCACTCGCTCVGHGVLVVCVDYIMWVCGRTANSAYRHMCVWVHLCIWVYIQRIYQNFFRT